MIIDIEQLERMGFGVNVKKENHVIQSVEIFPRTSMDSEKLRLLMKEFDLVGFAADYAITHVHNAQILSVLLTM